MRKLLLVLVLFFAGNRLLIAQNCPPPNGWSVKFCVDRTVASGAKLQYRIGGCDDCQVFEKIWRQGDSIEFQLPIEIRYAREIWIRAETLQRRKEIHLCLLYDHQSVREIKCNGDPETHDTEWTDRRHCACN